LPELQREEPESKESHLHTQIEVLAATTSQSDYFTQCNSLFNKEVLQVKCGRNSQYSEYAYLQAKMLAAVSNFIK